MMYNINIELKLYDETIPSEFKDISLQIMNNFREDYTVYFDKSVYYCAADVSDFMHKLKSSSLTACLLFQLFEKFRMRNAKNDVLNVKYVERKQ